ncbi:MAG: ABC transporter substrate-binding protein, partial [Armatimonadetes bacterium]|nr:ABC transporter substrate-binding protein [Armatimonadota bacterium]
MKLYIGIDDTDNKVMGGTGRLAREIAAELRQEYEVRGV